MSARHFFIWSCIAVLAAYSGFATFYVRQLRSRIAAMGPRIASLKAWADAYTAFNEHASHQESARIDDLNKRLVDIETENKTTAPVKRDDEDPLSGPRSWAAQSAAASRGAGVDYIA